MLFYGHGNLSIKLNRIKIKYSYPIVFFYLQNNEYPIVKFYFPLLSISRYNLRAWIYLNAVEEYKSVYYIHRRHV